MIIISKMYITLMPVIFAGVLNMVWCKLSVLNVLRKPIDGARCLSDGRRIFGDNKTWKGFFGMVMLGVTCSLLWGFLCDTSGYLLAHNFIYENYDNTPLYNLVIGALLGLAYAVFELPNSFIKRRFSITPGKTSKGFFKALFIFFDQADSIFGCVLVICLVYPMPLWMYFLYVFVGAITHVVINVLLYFSRLRKNMF